MTTLELKKEFIEKIEKEVFGQGVEKTAEILEKENKSKYLAILLKQAVYYYRGFYSITPTWSWGTFYGLTTFFLTSLENLQKRRFFKKVKLSRYKENIYLKLPLTKEYIVINSSNYGNNEEKESILNSIPEIETPIVKSPESNIKSILAEILAYQK